MISWQKIILYNTLHIYRTTILYKKINLGNFKPVTIQGEENTPLEVLPLCILVAPNSRTHSFKTTNMKKNWSLSNKKCGAKAQTSQLSKTSLKRNTSPSSRVPSSSPRKNSSSVASCMNIPRPRTLHPTMSQVPTHLTASTSRHWSRVPLRIESWSSATWRIRRRTRMRLRRCRWAGIDWYLTRLASRYSSRRRRSLYISCSLGRPWIIHKGRQGRQMRIPI